MREKIQNKRKKAEITTQQIVLLIILLASFVVLLFFLFKINFKDLSEKEICQSSIQLSGKKSFFSNIDCKTNYVCISGGKECEGFVSKSTIKINTDSKDSKNQTLKAIADEMVDCWWMFGEGKIDYTSWEPTAQSVCAVCSEIAFDSEIASSKNIGAISYKEIYDYMKIAKKGNTQSYLEYLGVDYGKLDSAYLSRSIEFKEKYGIYTGKAKSGVFPNVFSFNKNSEGSISPVLLKRTESSLLKCTSFVTTP